MSGLFDRTGQAIGEEQIERGQFEIESNHITWTFEEVAVAREGARSSGAFEGWQPYSDRTTLKPPSSGTPSAYWPMFFEALTFGTGSDLILVHLR